MKLYLRPFARLTALSLLPLFAWMDLVREEVGELAIERIKRQRPS